MSVILNPEIPNIDQSSLLYAVYRQLYQSFFNAQDPKSESNPYGIEEGDVTSIRLKNTAYTFATSICDTVDSGINENVNPNYLKKAGDDMSGKLSALYGLEVGANNRSVFSVTEKNINDIIYGVLSISGKLEISSDNLLIDGKNVLSYQNNELILNGDSVKVLSSLTVGTPTTGLVVNNNTFKYKNSSIYHSGNSNSVSVNWRMKDGQIAGALNVSGSSILTGNVTTEAGISHKILGIEVLGVANGVVNVNGWLTLTSGIKSNGTQILSITDSNVTISSGGSVILGNVGTSKIVLASNLYDYNESHIIIDKYGYATLQNGLQVRHSFGGVTLQSYRLNASDEGIIFPQKIRLQSQSGVAIFGSDSAINIEIPISSFKYNNSIYIGESDSYYKPLDSATHSMFFNTETDFFSFKKPIESKNFISIAGYSTRLTNNTLFFKENSYLLSVSDGIKHYGNAYFLGSISSEAFASGYSGYGMAITKNDTTGNYTFTVDEILVRKKIRSLEFETQITSATNGALWVSDSCSGDTVLKL